MSAWEESGKSSEWYTPPEIFDALNCEFNYDVASPFDRTHCCVPANDFIHENSLNVEWTGFVWMNPPFGGRNGITPWLNKIILHGNGIALTPDRTSAPWWQYTAGNASATLFINGKVKFIRPDGSRGKSPSTGTTLFAFGQAAAEILIAAKKLGITKITP